MRNGKSSPVKPRKSSGFKQGSAAAQIVSFLSAPAPGPCLWGIIVAGHLYGLLVYRAGYWVDSGAYIFFSPVFESLAKAREVFNTADAAIFSHLGWGVSFFWFLLSKLPEMWIWPAMAVIQHVFAAAAAIYLFNTLNRLYPTRLHLVTCMILSFLPFYQSMNNMLMTESITASCTLAALAAALNLNDNGKRNQVSFAVLLLATLIAIPIKSYFIIFSGSYLAILFVRRKIPLLKMVMAGVLCSLMLVASPTYRFMATGAFRMPHIGIWSIILGENISRQTPESVLRYINTLSWPDNSFVEKLAAAKISRDDLSNLFKFWRDRGLTYGQMLFISKTIFQHFLEDKGNSIRVFMASLTSLGFPSPLLIMPDLYVPQRGMSGKQLYDHIIEHYRYLSWINPSQASYKQLTAPYYFGNSAGHQLFLRAWAPYLRFPKTNWLNDPLGLGRVLPDIWFIIGMLALGYLVYRRSVVAAFFILPMAAMTAIICQIPVAGIRACYIFIIMDLISTSIALGYALQAAPVTIPSQATAKNLEKISILKTDVLG